MTASLILAAASHFVLTASSQKMLDERIPPERRRHIDRWSNESEDLSNEQGKENSTPKLSPITPRFTDYYAFVTRKEQVTDDQINPEDSGDEI